MNHLIKIISLPTHLFVFWLLVAFIAGAFVVLYLVISTNRAIEKSERRMNERQSQRLYISPIVDKKLSSM